MYLVFHIHRCYIQDFNQPYINIFGKKKIYLH
jgi:hypothetical protein